MTPVNDPPVANDDSASTLINTAVDIDVKANDIDPDNAPAQLVVSNPQVNPALGTVSVNPDGSLRFTPALNVTGPVTITYTLTDPSGLSDTATVTVNVGANTPPAGADATRTIAEDTPYTIAASDLGFSDADLGQTLSGVRIVTTPTNGTLQLNGVAVAPNQLIPLAALNAGQLRFVPDANENGTPYGSFTFSVQDSAGGADPTPNTFAFNVTPVNDNPAANPDAGSTTEDAPLVVNAANGVILSGASVPGARQRRRRRLPHCHRRVLRPHRRHRGAARSTAPTAPSPCAPTAPTPTPRPPAPRRWTWANRCRTCSPTPSATATAAPPPPR